MEKENISKIEALIALAIKARDEDAAMKYAQAALNAANAVAIIANLRDS